MIAIRLFEVSASDRNPRDPKGVTHASHQALRLIGDFADKDRYHQIVRRGRALQVVVIWNDPNLSTLDDDQLFVVRAGQRLSVDGSEYVLVPKRRRPVLMRVRPR